MDTATKPTESEPDRQEKKRARTGLPKDDPDYSVTPFDDVWRTIVAKLQRSVILLMNRLFGMSFTGEETLEPSPTEMIPLVLDPERRQLRRVDAHFAIRDQDGHRHVFHIECQTNPDGSIVLRFAEYDLQIALEAGITDEDGMLCLYMPKSGVINLRGSGSKKPIGFRIIDDNQVSAHRIEQLNMSDLSTGELLQPDGRALLPFYIFAHQDDVRQLAHDPETARQLVEEFQGLCKQLEKMDETGEISTFDHAVYLELMRKVTRNAVPGSTVSEEVAKVASGQILKLEAADRIAARIADSLAAAEKRGEKRGEERGEKRGEERGEKRGEKRGEERGIKKGKLEMILKLVHENLLTEAVGAAQLDMDPADFQKAYSAAYAE